MHEHVHLYPSGQPLTSDHSYLWKCLQLCHQPFDGFRCTIHAGTTAQFNTALSDADFATTALLEARVPVGVVSMWVTGTAPSGWLLCQGQEVSVSTYSALSSVIGTNYGTLTNGSGAAGTTHFRLPDLRGRVPMGVGTGRNVANSANLTARAFAAATFSKVSDAESVTLTAAQSGVPAHKHTNTATFTGTAVTSGDDSPDHGHSLSFVDAATEAQAKILAASSSVSGIFSGRPVVTGSSQSGGANARHQHSVTASGTIAVTNVDNTAAAASASHENIQPSTVINFIIKH